MRTYDVAVVGASGNVGREMLKILEERNFPVGKVYALASERSAGSTIPFKGGELVVENLENFDFSKVEIGLFSPGASVSKVHAPRAAAAGCVVVDNTSFFRMDPDVPLVVPEVNPEAIGGYKKKGIIANPNCSTIQMMVALKPIHDLGTIERVVVSTYQAVSGAGKDAMDELFEQTRAKYVETLEVPPKKFPKEIAFNLIPQIDLFLENGYTKEEMKMVNETKKILDPSIAVTATCVRVGVFNGHSESVNVQTKHKVTAAQAREALQKMDGVVVVDDPSQGHYITPAEASGKDATYVSRIREDESHENCLNFWCVSDNLRKGAALNAVQIAEVLIRDYLK
ncbi:aspartate semialdehyde dehydrogenase [Magnetococcus marinus MC-1]|uniref:Aspartate-semialdehyde dehydrogenase n=1 Tax=Magnetococcus marinus (strain ATCC BAA-1437 / JCM 17883 / MC-1) TaxID=156889 RepID=A0L8J7_MAGMM|nr:aspartate-semialdehyde dehydrogenase [Magnetococcus marinus]ABK44290.1 aspartate semialdehyde dehydrogenase [Magnetococcus marinus MC-1]